MSHPATRDCALAGATVPVCCSTMNLGAWAEVHTACSVLHKQWACKYHVARSGRTSPRRPWPSIFDPGLQVARAPRANSACMFTLLTPVSTQPFPWARFARSSSLQLDCSSRLSGSASRILAHTWASKSEQSGASTLASIPTGPSAPATA